MDTLRQPVGRTAPRAVLALRRFFLSPLFFLLLAVGYAVVTHLSNLYRYRAAVAIKATEIPVTSAELAAAIVGVALILFIFVISDDIFAAAVPFLMLTVLLSSCYNSYAVFIRFRWLLIPAVAALLFHILFYRAPFRAGKSFAPLLAVSLALTLGGVGSISAAEYWNATALYYVGGLGFGLLLFYLLLKSRLARPRDYSAARLLLVALLLAGVCAAFNTLDFYAVRTAWMRDDLRIYGHLRLININQRNVFATFLLLALPTPFYFARKRVAFLALAALFLLSLILTSSRGGMIFGTLMFFLSFLDFVWHDAAHRRRNAILFSIALALFAALLGFAVWRGFFDFRFANGFFEGPRQILLRRAWEDFCHAPIFGRGLGYSGNSDAYAPVAFAMHWYHMMIPQILASTGLVGVLAFASLFVSRARLALRLRRASLYRALALSYLSLFLMSQVNPGEFCPIPFALCAMTIFLLFEEEEERLDREAREKTVKSALSLYAAGLFGKAPRIADDTDFAAVFDFCQKQAIEGTVSEGLSSLFEDTVPLSVLFPWQNRVVAILRHNERLRQTERALLDFCASEKLPAAVLKGSGVARYYPVPDLRVQGDIDLLLLPEDLPRAGEFLEKQGFLFVPDNSPHQSVYKKENITVELHGAVMGIPAGEAGNYIRALLADTAKKAVPVSTDLGVFPVPDPCRQGVILLLHIQEHMREGGVGLRQVGDFALFLDRECGDAATRRQLEKVLAACGLLRFAGALSRGAARHLGLSPEHAPFTEWSDDATADALMEDFIAGGNFGQGNADFAGSGIVTKERKAGKSALSTALAAVADKCRAAFPVTRKHPALLSVFVPYWILRRLLRSLSSRPVRPVSMLKSAGRRGKLYDSLSLFTPQSTDKPS